MTLAKEIVNQWPIKIRSADFFVGCVGSGSGGGTQMGYQIELTIEMFRINGVFGLQLCHEQMMHLDEQTIGIAVFECAAIIWYFGQPTHNAFSRR